MDAYLSEHIDGNLSFYELVAQNVASEGKLQGVKNVGKQIWELFFAELAGGKTLLLQMLLLSCLFAFFQRLLVKPDAYVSQMSFFIVYGAVTDVTGFLQVLVPAYATTLMLSGNTASAGMFYELMFALIYLLEWTLKHMVVPGIHMYVLLELMDHFFAEHKFSKLADLIATVVRLFRKVAIGGVIGISAIQSLLAPARDRISQSAVLKSFSVLPGVGNGFHLAEEVLLGCGMLVKNSVGVAGLVVLLILCITPVIKVLCFTFLYKIIAAILQPVCDSRILGAVNGVAKGSSMYFDVIVDSMLLFLIAIAMVTASTSFIY